MIDGPLPGMIDETLPRLGKMLGFDGCNGALSAPFANMNRHSGAWAKPANPESRNDYQPCLWIPGPRLQPVPE
jgi:hypothetical protein